MPAILSENLDMGAFFMREKLKQFYIVLLVFILTIMGQYGHVLQTEAVFSTQKETVSAKSQTGKRLTGQKSEEKVYASGMPIGIYIKTEGILVLGLQQIDGKNSPASCKIKAGDYILKLNAQNITTKQQFIRLLQKNGEKEVVLTLKRKNKKIKVKVQPVYSAKNKCYQIEGGSAYRTNISSILKGKSGMPGEIIGTIDYSPQNYLGEIYANTNGGILGKITENKKEFFTDKKISIAKKSEVKTGKAYLRSSISGKSKDYSIEIEKVFFHEKNSLKTLKIRVTDSELITLTGGIIQGLSGSPILQNGKLVGAVTHVLIDNPQMGYGIFAESMLE